MTGRDSRVATPSLDGQAMFDLAADLYPIGRSITGEGVRQTLRRLAQEVPLTIHEVPSGTQVLDWTVPPEWNIRGGWIATTDGRRIVDYRDSNLHVVGYSRPIRARLSRGELDDHLHSLPDYPDWIPYRTSYYAESWGFCLTERQRRALTDLEYDVCIDSTLASGSLTYGECLLPGECADEILLSAHVCHPSLANDNLSGIAVLIAVIQQLALRPRRYTYRVLFAPGTIGALAWLARHKPDLRRIRHGLILTCVGDRGGFTYKRTRSGDATVDRAVAAVLRHSQVPHTIRPFSPDGYDERQYCSPGFNLPVGRLTRTPNGEFAEYHTSADNLDLIQPGWLEESARVVLAVLEVLEGDTRYVNLCSEGEPQLGRRGLYRTLGGTTAAAPLEDAIRWVLNFSDGAHSLLDIAELSGRPFSVLREAADMLTAHALLSEHEG